MRDLFCRIFHHLSMPRQDRQGSYQVCLDDGRRIPWRDSMPLLNPYRKVLGPQGPSIEIENSEGDQI
jgi:hypothetical protein